MPVPSTWCARAPFRSRRNTPTRGYGGPRTLMRGDSFGELGLLGSSPRAATGERQTTSSCSPSTRGRSTTARRRDRGSDVRTHLADAGGAPGDAGLLHPRHGGPLEVLAHGRWVTASPGVALVGQGEIGDAFYALRSGQADVLRDGTLRRTMAVRRAISARPRCSRRPAQGERRGADARTRIPSRSGGVRPR